MQGRIQDIGGGGLIFPLFPILFLPPSLIPILHLWLKFIWGGGGVWGPPQPPCRIRHSEERWATKCRVAAHASRSYTLQLLPCCLCADLAKVLSSSGYNPCQGFLLWRERCWLVPYFHFFLWWTPMSCCSPCAYSAPSIPVLQPPIPPKHLMEPSVRAGDTAKETTLV